MSEKLVNKYVTTFTELGKGDVNLKCFQSLKLLANVETQYKGLMKYFQKICASSNELQ